MLQGLIAKPVAVSYVLGDVFIAAIFSLNTLLALVVSIPSAFNSLTGRPWLKDATWAIMRLKLPLLALISAAGGDLLVAKFHPIAQIQVAGRWKVFAWHGFRAFMLQVNLRF
jgi:hypothetical protein